MWRDALKADAAWSCYYSQEEHKRLSERNVSLCDDFRSYVSQAGVANSFFSTYLLYAPFRFQVYSVGSLEETEELFRFNRYRACLNLFPFPQAFAHLRLLLADSFVPMEAMQEYGWSASLNFVKAIHQGWLKADRFVGLVNDALEALCSSNGVICVYKGLIDMEDLARLVELSPPLANALLTTQGLLLLREGVLSLGDVVDMSLLHLQQLVSEKGFECYQVGNFTLENWKSIPESCMEIVTGSEVTHLLREHLLSSTDVMNAVAATDADADSLLECLAAVVSSRESLLVDQEQKRIRENVTRSPFILRPVTEGDSFSENISAECEEEENHPSDEQSHKQAKLE